MRLYQAEHDNCEQYGDNHTQRENLVYKDKNNLIQKLLNEGYEEIERVNGEVEYYKEWNYIGVIVKDLVTIEIIQLEDD